MQEKIMVVDCQRDVDFENAIDDLDIIQYIVFDKNQDFYKCDTLTNAERLADDIQGTIYFYHTTIVNNIIASLDDEAFNVINNADDDRFNLDGRIRRNAKKRLVYHLDKLGLTLTDWEIWCTL